jgi:hypothetical protein
LEFVPGSVSVFYLLEEVSMKFYSRMAFAIAVAAIAFLASTANAAIQVGLNQIQYADREQLATYNDVTHTYSATSGGLAVGDHLYGVFATTTETHPAPPAGSGAFDLVVAKIIDPATGAVLTPATLATFTGSAEVLFTSDSAVLSGGETGGFLTGGTGTTYTLVDGSTINGLGLAANTLQSLYQGSTLVAGVSSNLDTLPNQAASLTAAGNGILFNTFGLGAALTDTSANSLWGAAGIGYWAADVSFVNGVLDTGSVPFVFGNVSTLQPNSLYQGLFNELIPLQLGGEKFGTDGTNIHNNNGATPLGPPALTATSPVTFSYVGGGHSNVNINGGPWPTTSSDPSWIDPKAPEPATMLLMGMGLAVGIPYLRRRQQAAV